jgi:hypothetical protein
LGILLYVISSGKDPVCFPEISTTLMGRGSHEDLLRLDAIILKACQPDIAQRYQTTGQMLKDLLEATKNRERPAHQATPFLLRVQITYDLQTF